MNLDLILLGNSPFIFYFYFYLFLFILDHPGYGEILGAVVAHHPSHTPSPMVHREALAAARAGSWASPGPFVSDWTCDISPLLDSVCRRTESVFHEEEC
jgi:hypothetical protein